MKLEYLEKLVGLGYNIITYGDKKKPNYPTWKAYHSEPHSFELLETQSKLESTKGFGLVTGYNGVEVVDVDTKCLSTLKEQNEFWNEYLSFLKDNIFDFDSKFVIKRTVSNGYHIIYKCSNPVGNTKLAKLEGHKEAIIETRGQGGYVCMYDRTVGDLDYHQIQEISDEDRELLWIISRTFNFEEPTKQEVAPRKELKEYDGQDITTWDDFNQKTNIWDIVQADFKIVRHLSNGRTVILRNGSKSASSGSIYSNGNMYLFSTGTVYPHEKLITPFTALMHRDFNGDFKSCCSYLYKEGFGTRIKKNVPIQVEEKEVKNVKFPISVYPTLIQKYILEANKTLDSSIDFLGSALLWTLSLSVGNSFRVKVRNDWYEKPIVWIAVVGSAGVGKTPTLNRVIKPIEELNSLEIRRYYKELEQWKHYETLSKKEKESVVERFKPIRKQFIVSDITLEALADIHQDVPQGLGVFRDELSGFLRDMNKYRAGSDKEQYLSLWSGGKINTTRKTAKSSFVENTFVPILGGIQPSILDEFYTDENKENGFMDRILLCYPEVKVERYNELEMDQDLIDDYNNFMKYFFETFRHNSKLNENGELEPFDCTFSDDAKKEWIRIFNEITDTQNSDSENEYLKSMYPKQKTYIPRFALLLHLLDYADDSENVDPLIISKKAMLGAEKLSHYFVENARRIKFNSTNMNEAKAIVKAKKGNKQEQFYELFDAQTKLTHSQLAEMFGVSRKTIHNWIKQKEK